MNPVPEKSRYRVSPADHPQPDHVNDSLPFLEAAQLPEVPAMRRIPRYYVTLVREKSIRWPSRRFHSSRDVWEFGKKLTESTDREQFWALMLDTKNNLIGVNLVAQGSLSGAVVVPREVLKPAILLNSAAILVLHNHPSGDPTPSADDRACTARLNEACKSIGIRLLDHLIIGESGYFSFSDEQGSTLCCACRIRRTSI